MKHILFSLMLIIIIVLLSCNTPTKKNASSNKHQIDSISTHYRHLTSQLANNKDYKKVWQALDSLKILSKKYNAPELEFRYLSITGFVYSTMGAFDSAKSYYIKAEKILPYLDNPERDRYVLKLDYATILRLEKKLDEAYNIYKEAYDYYKKIKFDSNMAMITYHLGNISNTLGNADLAKKYLIESMQYPAAPMIKTAVATAITSYYINIHNLDSAQYYFYKYVQPDTTLKNPLWLAQREEMIGNFYDMQGNYKQGLQQYLKAISIQRSANNMGIAATYANAAEMYFQLSDYNYTIQYCDSAILAASGELKTGLTLNMDIISKSLLLKAKAQKMAGNYKEAIVSSLSAYNEYKKMSDSAYAVKTRELEDKYASKEKDARIKFLAKQNTDKTRINKQQRIILVGSFLIFILLCVFGVSYYRKSKLKNKLAQIDLEQRLLRSQMEPHFLFNTLAVLQSFIRNDQKEKAVTYLNNFAKLLRSNLENSRKLYVSLEDELDSLKSYLNMQMMRSEKGFVYSIDVIDEDDPSSVFIYPMIIQPFVENSVQHGIQNLDYKGNLSVKIIKKERFLECTIDDNGVGLKNMNEKKSHSRGSSSLAIQITKERLALLSKKTKNTFNLILQNKSEFNLGQGTLVTLQIPYVYK